LDYIYIYILDRTYIDLTSLPFNGHFPGEPGLTVFIEAKDDGGGEWWQLDYWSYKSFLQAGCPSCRSTNSVKAL